MASLIEPFQLHKLDNGVFLLLKSINIAPIVSIDVHVGAGVLTENKFNNGISHFLEHMFFKGTYKRDVGEMDRLIKSFGGYNNAATSMDFTHYYVVLPAKYLKKAAELLIDALWHSRFDEEEIELEKKVVLEEISRRNDSPSDCMEKDFMENIFSGSQYAMPVLGTEKSLNHINRAEFIKYLDKYYTPSNVIISVVGDININEIIDFMSKSVGSYQHNNNICAKKKLKHWNKSKKTKLLIKKDVQQSYLLCGFAVDKIIGTKKEYALELASLILGSGRSSRLHKEIVDKRKLSPGVGSFLWTLKYGGVFGIEATYSHNNSEKVKKIIFEQIDKLTKTISDEDIDRAKQMMVSSFAFDTERMHAIAQLLSRGCYYNILDELVNFETNVRQLDKAFVIKTLEQYISNAHWIVSEVVPK